MTKTPRSSWLAASVWLAIGCDGAGGADAASDGGAEHSADGGDGGQEEGGSGGHFPVAGEPCREDDPWSHNKTCAGYATRERLHCRHGSEVWQPDVSCDPDKRCSTARDDEGRCLPVVPECEGKESTFRAFCTGSETYLVCGLNHLGREVHCTSNSHCEESVAGGEVECVCDDDFTKEGRECVRIDDCPTEDPCGSHGQCEDSVATYTCACEYGWGGHLCDEPLPLVPMPEPTDVTHGCGDDRAFVTDPVASAVIEIGLTWESRAVLSDFEKGSGPPMSDPVGLDRDCVAGRLLVVDDRLDALFAVDMETGARTVLSNDGVGSGPRFVTPRRVALGHDGQEALVLDAGLGALLRVDLDAGKREVVTMNAPDDVLPLDVQHDLQLGPTGFALVGTVLVDLTSGERSPSAGRLEGSAISCQSSRDPGLHCYDDGAWASCPAVGSSGCGGGSGLQGEHFLYTRPNDAAVYSLRADYLDSSIVTSPMTPAYQQLPRAFPGMAIGPDPDQLLVLDSRRPELSSLDLRSLVRSRELALRTQYWITTGGYAIRMTYDAGNRRLLIHIRVSTGPSSSRIGESLWWLSLDETEPWPPLGDATDRILYKEFPRDSAERNILGVSIDAPRERVVFTTGAGVWAVDPDGSEGQQPALISGPGVGSGDAIERPGALLVGPQVAYVLDIDGDALWEVDLDSGERVVVSSAERGSGPALTGPKGISHALVPDAVLVLVEDEGGRSALVRVDLVTGDRTLVASRTVGRGYDLFGDEVILDAPRQRALVRDTETVRGITAVDLERGDREIILN